MDSYLKLLATLATNNVRYVLIGVAGANLYTSPRQNMFATEDRDFLLPPEPENLLRCWQSFDSMGWRLWSGDEPLDRPMDLPLAEQVVLRRAAVQATSDEGLSVDLTLVMAGFQFDEVWAARRIFNLEGHEIQVARLKHIVESKRQVGRNKDLLFLTTHEEELRRLLARESDS